MKRFIKNIILFCVPFFLLIPIIFWFVYIGYNTGELKDIDFDIIDQREVEDSLLGMAYNEQNAYYKVMNANYYRADLIALGTSRVMQFRRQYFTVPFYNCGGGANDNFDSYLNFIKNLKYKPQVIILGLDCWVFNDNWNNSLDSYENYIPIEKTERSSVTILKALIKDWLVGKWSMKLLGTNPKNIGINGIIKNNGFRNDGSYCYGDIYIHPEEQKDFHFKDTFYRIDCGINRFEYGNEVDPESVQELGEFLDYCNEQGIYVFGFTAPLAPSVYSKMIESGNYEYLEGIALECESLFRQYDYGFLDYLDGMSLGYGDDYYVDGFHGGDIVYAEIARQFAATNERMSKLIDQAIIEELINKSEGTLTFGY